MLDEILILKIYNDFSRDMLQGKSEINFSRNPVCVSSENVCHNIGPVQRYVTLLLLSCQPRVTVTLYFVYNY